MKKKICIIFSLFLTCFAFISPVYANSNTITEMVIHAHVNEDGSAHIQEIWNMDIDEGTEVYKVFERMGSSKITNLKVSDETGKVYQDIGEWDVNASKSQKDGKSGIVTKSSGYELCFGIGEYGSRQYTFEYDISDFLKQYTNDKGVNFAFFSEMAMEPQHVIITLSSDTKFDKDNSQIWAFGYYGDVNFVDGKVVMQTTKSVPSNGKMQLLMRIDNDLFPNAKTQKVDEDFQDVLDDAKVGSSYEDSDDSGYGGGSYYGKGSSAGGFFSSIFSPLFPLFIIVVLGALGGLIGFGTKKGKNGSVLHFEDNIPLTPYKDVNMFRDIPAHKNIYEFYYLAKKIGLITTSDQGGLIAAVLLKWIQRGYIIFEKEEVQHMLFFKKDGFSINLNRDIPCDTPVEELLLSYFKQAAGSNIVLETKEFEKWCQGHYTSIEKWFDKVETEVETDYRQKGWLVSRAITNKFLGFKYQTMVDVYSASVREQMEYVAGLKKFLEDTTLIHEKEVIEVKLWEEYLIFASILGIADKVEKQLGQLCPTFNQQSHLDTLYTTQMVHMFAYSSMRATHSASQAASASSGFGGGSSFGGGGGGFSGGGGGGVR